ncbi:MAG: polyprenyl synthetase family protein [Anaerolineales bacterium]|nr:polyprenyl synthetase family protein [Anaerolineales bacterium]
MLRYHLGWIDEHGNPLTSASGKALRPTLCLLACEAISGDYHQALPAAAALELVHNFSLIHDDIQDDDRERRGRPSVWAVWGKPQAINAGTVMLVLAEASLMRLTKRGVPSDLVLKISQRLDENCMRLIEGQYLDIHFESCQQVDTGEYMHMIENKTAALIACSLELGALLATSQARTLQALNNFGKHLGLAFQIRDDILGVWGDQGRLGKPVGSDIWRKKKSYPIVFAWENASQAERAELTAIYQQEAIDEPAFKTVMGILDRLQAKDQAQLLVQRHCRQAVEEIQSADLLPWGRAACEEMVDFLARRDY